MLGTEVKEGIDKVGHRFFLGKIVMHFAVLIELKRHRENVAKIQGTKPCTPGGGKRWDRPGCESADGGSGQVKIITEIVYDKCDVWRNFFIDRHGVARRRDADSVHEMNYTEEHESLAMFRQDQIGRASCRD